jgi:hypothetical protein
MRFFARLSAMVIAAIFTTMFTSDGIGQQRTEEVVVTGKKCSGWPRCGTHVDSEAPPEYGAPPPGFSGSQESFGVDPKKIADLLEGYKPPCKGSMSDSDWAKIASLKCAQWASGAAAREFTPLLSGLAATALQGACGAKNSDYLNSGGACE